MDIAVTAAVALVFVGLMVLIWAVAKLNRFKVLRVKVDEAESGIDVALTKRYDTLTKMLDVVRAYTRHEYGLFAQIVNLRRGMSIAEKTEASQRMDDMSLKIAAVAENYPQLRSSENYMKLKDAIRDTEEHLQAARRVFNMNVSKYNQAIVVFPASIVAGKTHTARDFFEAEDHKRGDVQMSF